MPDALTAMMQLHDALERTVKDKFGDAERDYTPRMASFNRAVAQLDAGEEKSQLQIFAKAMTFVHDAEHAVLLAQDPRRIDDGARIVAQLDIGGDAQEQAKLVAAYKAGDFGTRGGFVEQMFNPPELARDGGKSRPAGAGIRQMRKMGY